VVVVDRSLQVCPFRLSRVPLYVTVSAAKTADLIFIMLDATKSDEQRRLLEIELDAVGIRLNKSKPDVVFKRRTMGGVSFQSTFPECERS
jgi:ribosome-interacting GTPase 1